MTQQRPVISELNHRSREVFRQIVEGFMESGEPVGSRTVAQRLETSVSPATIRNVMADLEDSGLLYAPHTSAGRMPTQLGMRMFVDGLLEVGNLTKQQRVDLEERVAGSGKSLETVLEEATSTLSGLSHCAGVVLAPKTAAQFKQVEFVNLSPGRALVVLVSADGTVENRIVEIPADVPASAFTEASNYLNARLAGRTLDQASSDIVAELESNRAQLDQLTTKVVEAGLASRAGGDSDGTLIVRGQANLLDDVTAMEDLERIRVLFETLETKEMMLRVLDLTDKAEGVQIFLGAENELFNLTGCSIVVAPYHSSQETIVGAIGVIGPTRMNYARIIPMVDYTAKLIGDYIG